MCLYGYVSPVLGEDISTISMKVMFAPCQKRACVFLSIKNDNISEGIESFHVRLERTPTLDNRITLSTVEGEIYITDDDGNTFFLHRVYMRVLWFVLHVQI